MIQSSGRLEYEALHIWEESDVAKIDQELEQLRRRIDELQQERRRILTRARVRRWRELANDD